MTGDRQITFFVKGHLNGRLLLVVVMEAGSCLTNPDFNYSLGEGRVPHATRSITVLKHR